MPRAAAIAILAAVATAFAGAAAEGRGGEGDAGRPVAAAAAERASATPPRAILQDDAALLYRGAAVRERTLDELRALGVDAIRVLVVWRRYAPAPRSARRPLDFDAGDSTAYPPGAFDALDGLVAGAAARGLDVLLTPTGPGPSWASECRANRQTCSPQPDDFRRFVAALGRRYPTVRHWAVWNEPNNPNWLTPQFANRRPRSPAPYRRLVVAAATALKATGHGGASRTTPGATPATTSARTTARGSRPRPCGACAARRGGPGCAWPASRATCRRPPRTA